jgi:FKBP12-rapamycin complex-associated protein
LLLYQRRLTATVAASDGGSAAAVDVDAVLGAMKCLDALGEWQAVVDLCFDTWAALHAAATEDKTRKKAAALAAHAAWSLGQWDNMERLVTVSPCGGAPPLISVFLGWLLELPAGPSGASA